jgi:hypothetical protein
MDGTSVDLYIKYGLCIEWHVLLTCWRGYLGLSFRVMDIVARP